MEIAVDHRLPAPSLAPSPAPSSAPSSALRDVLAELGERVKPVVLARERTLSTAAPFDQLIPDGLVRGRIVSCQGPAARSVAFGLVREALVEGAWMAIVDVSTFGTDAAAEFGVPLERVVRIDTGIDTGIDTDELGWIDVMGAAVDGFDIVLTRVPAGQRDRRSAAMRKLSTRVQQKGAVVVAIGPGGALGGDIELTTQRTVWTGLGDGTGHLRRRVVDVQASGRRMPERRSCSIELTGEGTRVAMSAVSATSAVAERDPQAELLAEMTDAVTVTDLNDRRRLAG